jgi:hypothetical protein
MDPSIDDDLTGDHAFIMDAATVADSDIRYWTPKETIIRDIENDVH